MAELALIRTAQGLVPATEADRETIQCWKAGQVIHGKFTKMRNARFHGKFFAMLDLAWEYWEPVGGLIPRQEMRGIRGLAKFFEAQNGRPGQLSNAVDAYIAGLEQARAERFPSVDKSREAFREWVTIEAGHFHLVRTPDGVRKEAKSISWASMDDTQFEPLYRDVFNACWRLVLSAHFETEGAALAAADQIGSFA
ncbi:DUF1367 family protein [Pseudomonas protegens]|uniref:Phage D3 protein n=1 Tax=Pseudomonas protegens (strain DSM 19095 / LMG 27888 / CFBP 6595 / CHA0) TaxID=1124983 RepID=A0A2C9EPI7_PSEPH|nr:DUF1367 family protein [Pseudomonas protegens]AGL85586.1 phage D3 protein [Pseudomonas protegens CHA0]MBP5112610.1 DUF1367 family protein [Pseudomonas protegens]QTU23026.1 DUF1367 family protein [Pseudomonas protegens]QTU32557.1 DUF1367 family protein [Pseudomonas protegens]RLO19790.1 DUF1367 family protein [Pseudomonas protegens]